MKRKPSNRQVAGRRVDALVRHPSLLPGIDSRDVQRDIGHQCLRELIKIFDLGGISNGRSLEADLAESAFALLYEETESTLPRCRTDRELVELAYEARRCRKAVDEITHRKKRGLNY